MKAEKPSEGDTEALEAVSQAVAEIPEETAVSTLQRDPITGHFLPGNKGGGRPKGSKDKVSQKLVGLMTDLMERRGEELIERIADNNPSDALAILTRIVPQAELQRIFLDGDGENANKINNIQITLVAKQDSEPALPSPSDGDKSGTSQALPAVKH